MQMIFSEQQLTGKEPFPLIPQGPYPVGKFFDYLLALNRSRLDQFCHWLFHPGMLPQASQQWWGKQKLRPTPHEGLDICWFRDKAGCQRSLPPATRIPAPFPGRVVQVSADFLGQSIFLIHKGLVTDDWCLLTAFGHTTPLPGVAADTPVQEGDSIATLAHPAGQKTLVKPHLHLTVAIVPADSSPSDFSWAKLNACKAILLLNPLVVFPTSFALVAS